MDERKRDKEDEVEKEAAAAKAKADAPELVTTERSMGEGGRRTRSAKSVTPDDLAEAAAETGTEPAENE